MFVCLFVCVFVCLKTPPREIQKYAHIIYGSKRNLPGKDYFVIRSPSDQPSGRYTPKSGQR